MCNEFQSSCVEALVRPDPLLPSSCCRTGNAVGRLVDLCSKMRAGLEAERPAELDDFAIHHFDRIDLVWLEQTIFESEHSGAGATGKYERGPLQGVGSYRRDDHFIVLAEADSIRNEMLKPPFQRTAQMPKGGEIYDLRIRNRTTRTDGWNWVFAGRFNSRQNIPSTTPQPSSSILSNVGVIQSQSLNTLVSMPTEFQQSPTSTSVMDTDGSSVSRKRPRED